MPNTISPIFGNDFLETPIRLSLFSWNYRKDISSVLPIHHLPLRFPMLPNLCGASPWRSVWLRHLPCVLSSIRPSACLPVKMTDRKTVPPSFFLFPSPRFYPLNIYVYFNPIYWIYPLHSVFLHSVLCYLSFCLQWHMLSASGDICIATLSTTHLINLVSIFYFCESICPLSFVSLHSIFRGLGYFCESEPNSQ